jgi:NitT/TauT family transport system substrate-binding protein
MARAVRFGFVPNPFAVPYYAALKYDRFTALGVRIEETRFNNGSALAEALAAREIDCGVGGHLQTLAAVLAGHDQVFIAPLAFEEPPHHLCICLVAGSDDLRSGVDLQGKAVAFSARGAMSDLQLRLYMSASRADFQTVRIVTMPFARMREALANGSVAAASVVEPFVSVVVASGAGRLIDRGSLSSRLTPGKRALITGVVSDRGWLSEHPLTAARVARAVTHGIDIVRRDGEVARRMIAEFTGVAPDTVSRMQLPAFYPDLQAGDLQLVFDLATAFGLVERSVDAAELIARLDSS